LCMRTCSRTRLSATSSAMATTVRRRVPLFRPLVDHVPPPGNQDPEPKLLFSLP
jgi:hypothetical protein